MNSHNHLRPAIVAKETLIVLVYDAHHCKTEMDDLADAILYFHPSQVTSQQRTALCGQIMGTTHFFKSVFSTPRIIALENGKFLIHEFGRYILAIGTDKNIEQWLLEYRANILTSLIGFFHRDLETVYSNFNCNEKFSAKLYHIFDTYIRTANLGSNIFSCIPHLQLPKGSSVVFLEAMNILKYCQTLENVLGGVMLYHNKYFSALFDFAISQTDIYRVLATQLSHDVNKFLVLTDPYRVKCPAKTVELDFELPMGVQLIQVFMPEKELNFLRNLKRCDEISAKPLRNKHFQPKELIKTAMKRDQSLIFTMVPEEENDFQSPTETNEKTRSFKQPERPRTLGLFTKTSDPIKSEIASSNAPSERRTSVCATPLVEKMVFEHPVTFYSDDPVQFEKDAEVEQETESTFDAAKENVETLVKDRSKASESSSLDKSEFDDNSQEDEELKASSFRRNSSSESLSKATPTNIPFPCAKPDSDIPKLSQCSTQAPDSNGKTDSMCSKAESRRPTMNLPLKPINLSEDTSSNEVNSSSVSSRKFSGTLPMTPLMAKLNLLAMTDMKTPCEYKDFLMTPSTENKTFSATLENSKSKNLAWKSEDEAGGDLCEVMLFVCGQKDMVLEILLEANAKEDKDLMKRLWEVCTDHLCQLEARLHYHMEPYSATRLEAGETYSYMLYDPGWETIKRGGPWEVTETGTLSQVHGNFIEDDDLTEMLIRKDESVLYGNSCGGSEVFYQQPTTVVAGPPPPADLMGTIPLKARRRLERDHCVVIL